MTWLIGLLAFIIMCAYIKSLTWFILGLLTWGLLIYLLINFSIALLYGFLILCGITYIKAKIQENRST